MAGAFGARQKACKTAAYIGKKAFVKVGAKVGGGAKVPGEKGNRRVEMNCGDVCDARVGPTADPADRAHGVMVVVDRKGAVDDGCTRLVPAAVKERRGRSGVRRDRCELAWHATRNLAARPRRYHESNMRGTLVEAGVVEDARGVPRRAVVRVIGRVSLDSVEDDMVERAERIKTEMGIDLLRGGVGASNQVGEVVLRQVRVRDLIEKARRFDWFDPDQAEHDLAVKRFIDRLPSKKKSSWQSGCRGRSSIENNCAEENRDGGAPGPIPISRAATAVCRME